VRTASVFQLMPHREAVKFLDENLKPLAIDLYDPEVWKQYRWSAIYSPDFRRRYGEFGGTNGRGDELDAYLAATLRRARRFHQALDSFEGSHSPITLLAIGGDCEETLNSPIILRDQKENSWLTLTRPHEYRTSSGVKISKRQMIEAMYAPGDGRVTRASLVGQNLTRYVVFGCDLHGQLQRNKTLQDNALTAIVSEMIN